MENSLKSIPISNPAIMENMECSIISARAPVIDLKVEVSVGHDVSLFFQLLRTHWVTFQAYKSVRSTSARTAFIYSKSHSEAV